VKQFLKVLFAGHGPLLLDAAWRTGQVIFSSGSCHQTAEPKQTR
jgi:hypothetical protein